MHDANGDICVVGGGDINSRVGDVTIKTPDQIVNSHGLEVIKICETFKCLILNNMSTDNKNFDGKFTFHKGDRKSQNDIVLSNFKAIHCIRDFKIHELNWNPSDHCPVSTIMQITITDKNVRLNASADLLTTAGEFYQSKPKRIYTKSTN